MAATGEASFTGRVKLGRAGLIRRVRWRDAVLARGAAVVVRSERGTELATLIDEPSPAGDTEPVDESRVSEEVRYLRPATPRDHERISSEIPTAEAEGLEFFKAQVGQLELPMNPVEVEQVLGGERMIFFFTSEKRVDFRGLVRILAQRFRTRVELRRVNPRELAVLQGGLGICGREICCKCWLAELLPVTIKMARLQQRPISVDSNLGTCGRLRCCLRYELENYGGCCKGS